MKRVTPKRRRTVLHPKNVACWVGVFVRHDSRMSIHRGLASPQFPVERLVDRYLEDVQAEGLRENPEAMVSLRREMEAALLKVWDISTGDDGMVQNAEPLDRIFKGGKEWFTIPSATIHFAGSGFNEKDLTTRGSITGGTACVYCCAYCSTPTMMGRSPHTRILRLLGIKHADAVIRRFDPVKTLRMQLTHRNGTPRFKDDRGVVIISPIVDPLPNIELMEETFELIMLVLQLTGWDVRVLTKSLLIRKLAERIPEEYRLRIIYGLSIGILDDGVASLVERLTPPPSQRIKAYRELQQQGLRTYSMHCPILPQADYRAYAERLAASMNWQADELIWAEALNLRGDSIKNTITALAAGGFRAEADLLAGVSGSRVLWETQYNRPLFEALVSVCPPGKLRYLVYPAAEFRDFWLGCRGGGAVVLGEEKAPH
jgi:DNA repair photolyase